MPDAIEARPSDGRNRTRRLRTAGIVLLVAAVALILASMLSLQLLRSSRSVYQEMRGAPSLGLLAGTPIFQGKQISGPLFCVPYSPLFYVLYAPIGLWKHPHSVLLAGSLMAFAFYSLPLWYIALRFRRDARRSRAAAVAVPLLFLAITLCSAPLAYSSTQLHADAPALGFAGLACGILQFHHASRRWIHPILSGLMTILAVSSKQVMLPLLILIPLLGLLLGNRIFSIRYLVSAIAFALVAAGSFIALYGGASAIVFNIWTVPSHIPIRPVMILVAIAVLHREALWLLFTLAMMTLTAIAVHLPMTPAYSRRVGIFPAISLAFLPTSLFTMMVTGADQNALSPPIYFALISVGVLVYDSAAAKLPVARFWVVAAAITAGLLVPSAMQQLRPVSLKEALSPGTSETAFEYSRRHPGDVYFPDHQLSVYLAEGRFYHSDWGVGNYVLAGVRPTRDRILAYIPSTARYVAYPLSPPGHYLLPYLAPNRKSHFVPDLPGFEVFEIER
jgi:hypothetical protein